MYRAYWELAAERHAIFQRRLAGDAAPWTTDPILAEYRFTNPWRASDRVSQFLIRDVIYDEPDLDTPDLIARIVLFRLFSRPATWRALERRLGPIRARTLTDDELGSTLEALRLRGPIYTNAFILCATKAYGHERKYLNHIALVQDMLGAGGLPASIERARSLKQVYTALSQFPLIGPFMAYQLAIDLNYSPLLDFSEDEFTAPGPGAERGIRKMFPDARRSDMSAIIHRMVAEQDDASASFGLPAPRLSGMRPLRAIDCQNLFCELDKYARVRFPDLRSSRTRIKARFTPAASALPEPFYPPKWGMPAHPAAETPSPSTV